MGGPLFSFSLSLPPHLHVWPDQPPTRILLEEALQERPENEEKGQKVVTFKQQANEVIYRLHAHLFLAH